MRRVLAVCVLALAAAAGALATSGGPAGGVAGFGDVDAGRFYTAPVQWMVINDITTGVDPTCFRPEEHVTRGQFAAFLWRMEGSPAAAPHPFNDVTAAYQQGPVSWLFANGITTGTTPDTYAPDDYLTRGQLAAMVHRLAGSPAAAPSSFGDVTVPWQITPVGWMEDTGLTTGTSPTTFSPDDAATRGQAAAFLFRYKGSPPVIIDPTSPFCAPPTTTTTTTTLPSGAAVFATNCSGCHGADGSGGFGPNLIGNTLSTSAIRTQIENGGGAMPGFAGELSNAEITAVTNWVAAL